MDRPTELQWIVGSPEHYAAWESAANWVHANIHPTSRATPCYACWHSAAYATKGVILVGTDPQGRVTAAMQKQAATWKRRALRAERIVNQDLERDRVATHAVRGHRGVQFIEAAAMGMTVEQMARRFYVSRDTVKTTLSLLYRRLGARDRAHAVALAVRHGLITLDHVYSDKPKDTP